MQKELFKSLFDAYYNALCNYVAHRFQLGEEAEDIVMDVFTQIWDKKTDLQQLQHPKSYLFTSVYRKAIEHWRQHKSMKMIELSERFVIPDDNEADFEEYLLKERLYQSIRQLPAKCQLIFVKAKLNGMSHKDIAAELNISIKTIENQITKAYTLLKKELSESKR